MLAKEVARVQAARDLQSIKNAQKEFEQDQLKAFEEQLADLETEIAIEQAITQQKKDQLRLEQEIRKVQGDDNLTDDQKKELEEKLRALERAREENRGVSGYIKQLQAELLDTEAMIVSPAQTIESEIANAMSSAVIGLIDGTTKVEDALANMFEAIGRAFIDMATQIIAKQLVMITPSQSLAPGAATPSAGDGPNVDAIEQYSGIGNNTPMDPYTVGLASGGFVTSPTKAMVGEGGENEFVIPEQDVVGHAALEFRRTRRVSY